MAKTETMTDAGSHVATQRGYADNRIIEPGEPVPAGIAVATEWMAPASEAPAAAGEEAAEAAGTATDERWP